jgi:hypothetical protein
MSAAHDLISATTVALSRPKQPPADSFQLHAPLELLTRVSLLERTGSDDDALGRIDELRARYESEGEEYVPAQIPRTDPDTTPQLAAEALIEVVGAGTVDDADPPATWLGDHVGATELTALIGSTVLPCVSAAGHGAIFFQLLAKRGDADDFTTLFRSLAREVARNPTARIDLSTDANPSSVDEIVAAIGDLPAIGPPEPSFIWPLVDQAQQDPAIAAMLRRHAAPSDLRGAATMLLRLSQWSMLADDEMQVPYGWTHGLTLPAAALHLGAAIGRPDDGWKVALTYVVAHRAGLATRPLREPTLDTTDPDPVDLASRAGRHHDAHVAKYVLICLGLAETDSVARSLHLQAADRLLAWWSA